MSSIDPRQQEALIRFFHANVLPLSVSDAGSAVPWKAKPPSESCYLLREWTPLRREDFELALDGREEIAAALDAFWAATPLRGLGRKIAGLSRKFTNVRQSADVSPFIYEMF